MISRSQAGAIMFERNPYYYGGEVGAQRVKIDFVPDVVAARTGVDNQNIDVIAADRFTTEELSALEGDAQNNKLQVSYVSSPIWEHIDFNLDTEVLQDIRVRRAIAFGTNRQRMVDTLYHGHVPVLESWILPGQPDAVPVDQLTRYPYNPDQARALLDEAGFLDADGDGIRATETQTLTLQLFTSEGTLRQDVAELFREDMKAIGVDVELVPLSNAQLFSADGPLFLRQFDLALYAWIASPDAGGLQLWGCLSVPSERNNWIGENFAGWCFRDADRAIREAVTTGDAQARADAYLKHQQLWTQELPVLPLFQRLGIVAAVPDVQGLQPDPLAPITWNIARWTRSTP
jgi:peptide/nickel transport system substrate-binding protein